MSLRELVEAVRRVPVLRTWWRFGYGTREAMAGYGWRHCCWRFCSRFCFRFWWFDPRRERDLLERVAIEFHVKPIDGESNASLRARIEDMFAGRRRDRHG